MRKITINEHISLDGVIQAPGGPDKDRDGDFRHVPSDRPAASPAAHPNRPRVDRSRLKVNHPPAPRDRLVPSRACSTIIPVIRHIVVHAASARWRMGVSVPTPQAGDFLPTCPVDDDDVRGDPTRDPRLLRPGQACAVRNVGARHRRACGTRGPRAVRLPCLRPRWPSPAFTPSGLLPPETPS